MLLAIDIGNTNTVVGLYDQELLVSHWRLATSRNRTSDELGVLLSRMVLMDGFAPENIHHAIIASVVPSQTQVVERTVERFFKVKPLEVGPGIRTGMQIKYENPKEVGADRIVNAVAAYRRYNAACVVVDFGTAMTLDCISDKGDYLGGVIAPGPMISMDALSERASKLPRIELERPAHAIGRNTVASMQAGAYFGYLEMTDGLIRRVKAEIGDVKGVIATGGLAGIFADVSEEIDDVDQFLTLDGLRIIHSFNV